MQALAELRVAVLLGDASGGSEVKGASLSPARMRGSSSERRSPTGSTTRAAELGSYSALTVLGISQDPLSCNCPKPPPMNRVQGGRGRIGLRAVGVKVGPWAGTPEVPSSPPFSIAGPWLRIRAHTFGQLAWKMASVPWKMVQLGHLPLPPPFWTESLHRWLVEPYVSGWLAPGSQTQNKEASLAE